MTTATFEEFVATRFGGKLYKGAHDPNGHACLHEALNVYQGKDWSDDTSGTLDLRSLNDGPWSSDEARTAAMLPLGAIVLGWPKWSAKKRQAWAKAVSLGVIQRILPPTLRRVAELLPDHAPALVAAALRCETTTLDSAAYSAADSAAYSAADSAYSAADSAYSAYSAADSAAYSAADSAYSAYSAARSAAYSAADSAYSAYSAARSAAYSAYSAAYSAADSAAYSAAYSADSAYSAARSAAYSAADDVPLQELCRIMLDAAR